MILGTCNFQNNYNGVNLTFEKCNDLLNEFKKIGGEIIDTGFNYGNSQYVIGESSWNGKIITKIWEKKEIKETFQALKRDKIFCIMIRDNTDKELLNYLFSMKKEGLIDRVGISIYYPHEIIQKVNCYHIPNNVLFDEYLSTMQLSADIYIRSNFNLYNKLFGNKIKINDRIKFIKKNFERKDLNHVIDFVVGCDNIEQLKENMRLFNEI